MRDKILFMLRGGEVQRFHTLRTIQEDSVGYHSFGVAWLCHLLEPAARKELILAALAHDLAEQEVGDTPAPTKLALGISESMGKLEDSILRREGFGVDLSHGEKLVLKLADCFQGMLFCIRERSLGNRGVELVFVRYRGYVTGRINHAGWYEADNMLDAMDKLWEDAKNGNI